MNKNNEIFWMSSDDKYRSILFTLSKAESDVYWVCIAKSSVYDPRNKFTYGCEIIANMPLYAMLSELTGLNNGTIRNAIASLCKKKLLISICRGVYYLNPHVIYKGNIAYRKDLVMQVDKLLESKNTDVEGFKQKK